VFFQNLPFFQFKLKNWVRTSHFKITFLRSCVFYFAYCNSNFSINFFVFGQVEIEYLSYHVGTRDIFVLKWDDFFCQLVFFTTFLHFSLLFSTWVDIFPHYPKASRRSGEIDSTQVENSQEKKNGEHEWRITFFPIWIQKKSLKKKISVGGKHSIFSVYNWEKFVLGNVFVDYQKKRLPLNIELSVFKKSCCMPQFVFCSLIVWGIKWLKPYL
jgi:hypothetical protein